mmetsp:Transcript_29676/g.77832  ORF Transcript_29676/g.77832 Transcript_29676/m.77832 type:complete len:321 (-) Transcript_29676:623-1585(-)
MGGGTSGAPATASAVGSTCRRNARTLVPVAAAPPKSPSFSALSCSSAVMALAVGGATSSVHVSASSSDADARASRILCRSAAKERRPPSALAMPAPMPQLAMPSSVVAGVNSSASAAAPAVGVAAAVSVTAAATTALPTGEAVQREILRAWPTLRWYTSTSVGSVTPASLPTVVIPPSFSRLRHSFGRCNVDKASASDNGVSDGNGIAGRHPPVGTMRWASSSERSIATRSAIEPTSAAGFAYSGAGALRIVPTERARGRLSSFTAVYATALDLSGRRSNFWLVGHLSETYATRSLFRDPRRFSPPWRGGSTGAPAPAPP